MSPVWILLTLLPILGGAERFNCKTRILGAYYADAKSGCKAFHVCVRVAGGGVRDFRFFCPPGTLFHQEAQTCTDWGDDDPLACPADIYDGQFDLYKIGSGFDTKKLSHGSRDDEAEFGLQRAETGDRRLSQNNVSPNQPDSDLRAAHSSDFFSGQRERGRDESSTSLPASSSTPKQYHARQSFRRPTSARTLPTTQYTTPTPNLSNEPSNKPQNDGGSKRKLVRKRPIYVSTKAPTTTVVSITPPRENYPEPQQQAPKNNNPQQNLNRQQNFNRQQNVNQQQNYNSQQNFKPQQNLKPPHNFNQQQNFNPEQNLNSQKTFNPQQHLNSQQNFNPQQHLNSLQNFNPPQNLNGPKNFNSQPDVNRRTPPQNKQSYTTTPHVPPQYIDYKDEYVEVSRVTPKHNRYYPSHAPSTPFPAEPTNPQKPNKKDGLVELYNYDAQSTPGLNVQKDNRPFKIRNSFNVADVPRDPEYARAKNFNNARDSTTTIDYSVTTRVFPTTTVAYNNYNSVSYEPEKNNFVPYSKQNNFKNYPTTTTAPITTIYTTFRPEPPPNLNTVAYNTNIGFNAQTNNYPDSDEDDGQYHPPEGEDDGLYRPEIYDRELLSGAHSLNIAASGNRLPEDHKTYSKTQAPSKPGAQTAAPRPFKPAPTPTAPPTTRVPDIAYTTTSQPQTVTTQRAFDYFQTYTTTSRPVDYLGIGQTFTPSNDAPVRPTTTVVPRVPETRPPRPVTRASVPPTYPTQPPTVPPPRPSSPAPHFINPPKKKEDNSYDYAYYDSDPGFSEYDQIEEFGRTNTKNKS